MPKRSKGSGSHNLRDLFGHSAPKKPNKFGAKKTTVYGITFHSGHEAKRYLVLRHLQQQGKIQHLTLQVAYKITVNGIHVTEYRSDFEYLEDGEWVVEDAKGHRTREYLIKRNLMKAVYGITIRET